MNEKPLSYPSLKTVLQHITPKFRINLAHRIPGIRIAEKNAPIFIRSLIIMPALINLDGDLYIMECFRDPPLAGIEEDQRGFHFDFNQYGFRDWSNDFKILPGDVYIPPIENEKDGYNRARREQMEQQFELDVKRELEQSVAPYKTFLRFRRQIGKAGYNEILCHDRKIGDAMKFLYSKIFGGRRDPIRVHSLFVLDKGIHRYPKGLKLHPTYSLTVPHNVSEVFGALKNIIDERSFPLKCVILGWGNDIVNPVNYNHPWIQTAERLRLGQNLNDLRGMLLNVKVPKIECASELPSEAILTIIRQWMLMRRKIGTDFTIEIDEKDILRALYRELKDMENAKIEENAMGGHTEFPDLVVFPMSPTSELCIVCEQGDEWGSSLAYKLHLIVTTMHHRNLWSVMYWQMFGSYHGSYLDY